MKRIGCLIAALSLLMTLSACHTGGEAEQTLRIGVALYQQEDTFIETVTRELQRVALEKEQAQNCKINLYITDGKESQTSQNEQVDRFLERGYDVRLRQTARWMPDSVRLFSRSVKHLLSAPRLFFRVRIREVCILPLQADTRRKVLPDQLRSPPAGG